MVLEYWTPEQARAFRDYEPTKGLSALSADELTQRLKDHVELSGALMFASDLEVARECVRRARQAEAAEATALELRRLTGDPGTARTTKPAPGYQPG